MQDLKGERKASLTALKPTAVTGPFTFIFNSIASRIG
jgi:hypothetical protein